MTTEQQIYNSHINHQIGSTILPQIIVAAVMIASALMLLEKLV